jgi:N-acetyltransferase
VTRRLPTQIAGKRLILEPLSRYHIRGLEETCNGPDAWEKVWHHLMDAHLFRDGGIPLVVHMFLERQRIGSDMPFAMILPPQNPGERALTLGITRFLEIEWANDCVEIGTLIGTGFQGKGINLDSKLAMLNLAFDHFEMERVQFKVDVLNARSLAAMEKMGAKREGELRRHLKMADGRYRTSIMFSILREEWPSSRTRLEASIDEQYGID